MVDRETDRLRRPAFYALVIVAVYISYLVLGPFLVPLAWAAVFAVLFRPLQVDLAPKIGANRAALLATLLAAILIVVPAVMLVSVLAHEAAQVADLVQNWPAITPERIERIWSAARSRIPFALPEDPSQLIREGITRVLTFLAPRAGAVVADVFATVGTLVAMLFALFFLLRDGEIVRRHLHDLLPLPAAESDRLMRETRDLVFASVGAGVLVAVTQGAIGGVAFWALGISAPAFWGVVMAFCSLIPLVGATLVWVPVVAWLMLSGHVTQGLILTAVGVFGIGLADNILRPLLLSGRTQVNGLVIFVGLLGGVAAFGFIGLVLGPIILVVTWSLLKMFARPDLVEPRVESVP